MKGIVLLALSCLLLVGLALPASIVVDDPVVTFPDPNLEAVIREALAKTESDIHASELGALTTLLADDRQIRDLSGLEHCTRLTQLSLDSNHQLSDLSPLANLTSLTSLSLGGCQVGDISSLANLTALTSLELHHNRISDISPVAELTNLTLLHLHSNRISDISPLANLAGLTILRLGDNQISDISALANLTNLTSLSLSVNRIEDLSPLVRNEGLSTGDWIGLCGNPLNSHSLEECIPQLRLRGVIVEPAAIGAPKSDTLELRPKSDVT